MGIQGLYTLLTKNLSRFEVVDLVSAAKSANGIEILVDSCAFMRTLIKLISDRVVEDYNNGYLLYQMAEYDIIIDAVCEFHKRFLSAGIKLVWIFDGPKGLNEEEREQKMTTWIERDQTDIRKFDKILQACEDHEDLRSNEDLKNLGPFLNFESLILGLKKADAEVIRLLQGGSDDFIAFQFIERKSFAVITNDTDFLIFQNIKVIFPQLMNSKYQCNDTKLPFIDHANHGKIFQTPISFMCPIITQRNVLEICGFNNQEQLIALSVIKGNDYTRQHSQKLRSCLGNINSHISFANIMSVAQFIATNQITEKSILELTKNLPSVITESIKFSYNFYTLLNLKENLDDSRIVHDALNSSSSLTKFFQQKFSESNIPKDLYSIHCGIFHELLFFEKPSDTCLSNFEVLSEIRSKIYPYVLKENLDYVTEWQSRNSLNRVKIPVKHSVSKTHMIKGKPDRKRKFNENSELESSVVYGIDLFDEIWSHLEENPLKYMKTFGLHRGFLCYMLRYFYKNTINKNLKLSLEEFQALFVTVFYQYKMSQKKNILTEFPRSSFLGMRICPTKTCLIIFSWFMNIYFTGKYLCGGAFNLIEDFPSLDQVMSASVWFAFYEHTMAEKNFRISHLTNSVLKSLEDLKNGIIKEFNAEYEAVTI